MSAERPCEVCRRSDPQLLHDVGGHPVVRCRGCGLVFAGQAQTADELAALYDAGYWEDPGQEGYGGYAAAEARKRHHFGGLLGEVQRRVDIGDLLEIGSAYGFFLDEARRRGWRVRGVETSPHANRHARDALGIDIADRPFTELPVEPESVDCIALWDVVEHLPDPRRTLEHAHAWLRPGGLVALSTGDVESLTARLHGRDWSLLTPPWHQFFFSRATMRRLLEDVGFRVERIGGDGVVGVDATSRRPRVPRPIAAVATSRAATTLARRLGAGGVMFVFARKGTR